MNVPIMDENEATTKDMANLIELLLDKYERYWVPRSRAN
jgi:hypothetical protein